MTLTKRAKLLNLIKYISKIKKIDCESENHLYYLIIISYWIERNNKYEKYQKDWDYKQKLDSIIKKLNEKKEKKLEDDGIEPIETFLIDLKILPKFEEYEIVEIIYWIEKAPVINKESKNGKGFFNDIYLYQKEKDIKIKKELIINILDKIGNYIKYANKIIEKEEIEWMKRMK
jgi:hypothetical protein